MEGEARRKGKKGGVKGIYKRSNSRYYWICFADLDGKIIRKSSQCEKFKDAYDELIEKRKQVKDGKQPITEKIPNYSFEELARQYLSWVKGRQQSAKIKEYVIGQLLREFSNLPLRKFSTVLVERLQTDIINKGRKPATNN